MLKHRLIELDPEPWLCWKLEGTVSHYQGFHQHIFAFGHRDVLKHPEIGNAGRGVNRGRGAHGAVAVMGDYRAIVGLCHGGNLTQFVHPPGIDCVGLDEVTAVLFQQLPKLEAGNITLASGDGGFGAAFKFHVSIEVFRWERFLHEIEVELLKALGQPTRLRQIETTMSVDHQVYVRPYCLTHLAHTFHRDVLLLWRHRMSRIAKGAPLEGPEAIFYCAGGAFGILADAGAAHAGLHEPVVAIAGYGFAIRPAEKFITGHP